MGGALAISTTPAPDGLAVCDGVDAKEDAVELAVSARWNREMSIGLSKIKGR
jgi:hypothetical protein